MSLGKLAVLLLFPAAALARQPNQPDTNAVGEKAGRLYAVSGAIDLTSLVRMLQTPLACWTVHLGVSNDQIRSAALA